MRTFKSLISAVLLVFSLSACSPKTVYTTYTLNPAKTMVLVKSYWCEDTMNSDFETVSAYLAQPPVLCEFSTLELSADEQSAWIHTIYREPAPVTAKPDASPEVDIPEGTQTELTANATLDMPQTFTKGEASTVTLSVSGSRLYDRTQRRITTGFFTELVFRPMTVNEKVYQTSFTDPITTMDTEFDALADPWQLQPETEQITSFSGDMSLTIPESVNSKTICLMGRLMLSHFEYIIFIYYEGQL